MVNWAKAWLRKREAKKKERLEQREKEFRLKEAAREALRENCSLGDIREALEKIDLSIGRGLSDGERTLDFGCLGQMFFLTGIVYFVSKTFSFWFSFWKPFIGLVNGFLK
jgi:hypothetical protein